MKLALGLGINARTENLEGMVSFTDNYALHFDGTNDSATVTNDVFKTFTGGGFSVSYWLKQDAIGTNNAHFHWNIYPASGTAMRIFVTTDGAGSHEGKYKFQVNDANGSSELLRTNSVVESTDWKHIVVTAQNSDQLRMFINGTEITAVSGTGTAAGGGVDSDDFDNMTTTVLEMGQNGNDSSFLDGKINDWAFFNKRLDADNIAAIYNSGTTFDLTSNKGDYDSSSNLKAYYRMEEGSGTTVVDSSGNTGDLTLVNGTAFVAT